MISILPFVVGCSKPPPGPRLMDLADGPVRVFQIDPVTQVCHFDVSFRAGSAHDPPSREGLATATALTLAQPLAGADLGLQVMIGPEIVSFRVAVLADEAEAAAQSLASLWSPTFAAPPVIPPTQSPEPLAPIHRYVFQGHPYQHHKSLRPEVAQTLRIDEVRRFFQRRYVRGAAALGISCDVGLKGLQQAIEALPQQLHVDATPRGTEPVHQNQMVLQQGEDTVVSLGTVIPLEARDWAHQALASVKRAITERDLGVVHGEVVGDARLALGTRDHVTRGVQQALLVRLTEVSPEDIPFVLRLVNHTLEGDVDSSPPAPVEGDNAQELSRQIADALLGPLPEARAPSAPVDRLRIIVEVPDPEALEAALTEEKATPPVYALDTMPMVIQNADAAIATRPLPFEKLTRIP